MSMRDDITPTNREPIEVLQAQLDALKKDPKDADLFFELRVALRKSGQAEPLAQIGELHAPHVRDRRRAADIWSEAGVARLQLGHEEQGEEDLYTALRLDPANERAAARIAEHLMVGHRFAEAAQVLEDELAELIQRTSEVREQDERKGGSFVARRAHRHRMLAQLWDERLGRIDRALVHWQKAWQLEPERGDALEAARTIYQSLGDEGMVAKLYQAELEVLGEKGPRDRRAAIELELGRIEMRQGDAMAAANHLEVALRLDPKSGDAREALAEVYASDKFASKVDRQRRASELFVELGERRMATKDDSAAIGYLRRALGVDPYHTAGSETLERALIKAERWEELDKLYVHQVTGSDDANEKLAVTAKRVKLYEDHLDDRVTLKKLLIELAASQPHTATHGTPSAFSRRLRNLYQEDEEWEKLVQVAEYELPALEGDTEAMCRELLELATIRREHLGERDHAAELLHRVLSIDPANEEALARYADHFRERRDWRGLADLLEFAFDNARDAGASPSNLVRQLEELAQIAELRLGDVDRAIATWNRIAELEPENPKSREALRRLMSRAKMWASLVGVLEQEAANAHLPQQRAEALRRIAQVYRERQVNPRRAIALYEEVLTTFPGDESVLKALSELYEREGDDAGLANTLRRQLELDVTKLNDELETQGKRAPTAREWPVAKRVERLTTLRRLATMYEQRLADVDGVVFACTGILEILPGDRDALTRMETVLEKAGDIVRLEQTLEYHASSATGPAERGTVLKKLAELASQRDDDVNAMDRWEQVLKAAPSDADALSALTTLYQRHRRWGELVAVMERSLMTHKGAEDDSPPSKERVKDLRSYARVVDTELGDAARAVRAWTKVLDAVPKDRDSLNALARLYEEAGRWRDLAEVLAEQAPLYVEDDPEKAAAVALQRAQLLEERLGAPGEATKALEALINDLDPANLAAHTALRRLHEARGDFEAGVRIAEREMYLLQEPQQRISRGLEIGLLCRDRLSDPTRALQAFERVLELQPDHEEALLAASDLHARVGNWAQHIAVIERRIEMVPEGRERRALMTRIAQATAERLGEYKQAFSWLRRAHEHAPDASTITELRRAAEAYGLWRELAKVYDDERERLTEHTEIPSDVNAYVAASRELASINERRLDNRPKAMNVLLDALNVAPADSSLLSEAQRIAVEGDDKRLWTLLLECLQAPLEATSGEARVALHVERARVREERLAEPRGAVEELLKAFAHMPEREETRLALYQQAERTKQWKEVVSIEAALSERATTNDQRVAVLRRKASVIEEHLNERVRAFRTHLQAFLLSPEDSETVGHLWRLAKAIGEYRPAQKRAAPEPAPAYVEPARAPAQRRPKPRSRPVIASAKRRREITEEISLADVVINDELDRADKVDLQEVAKPKRADQTMPIDISDLEIAFDPDFDSPAASTEDTDKQEKITPEEKTQNRADPTMELRTEDLIQALGGRAAPPPPPAKAPEPRARKKGPPPPPARPPKIKKRALPGTTRHDTGPKPKQAPVRPARRTKAPVLPEREYESPWEEFATAFSVLATPNQATKLRWLFRAAEVWETGAENTDKAFTTLAEALAMAPNDTEPRARLHRLAESHSAHDRLAELFEASADKADTQAAAVGLLMEVADIRAHQQRPRQAETLYRRILGMRPDDADTRAKLEALYREQGRWVDLAASLEERTDVRLGTAAPATERPGLLRELASIYRDNLNRPHDAIDALVRLRDLTPEDVDIIHQLAELYSGLGRWSHVIDMLNQLKELMHGTSDARDALRRIGQIYEEELELPDRAIDAYSQILSSWSDDTDAYVALDRLYNQHARWQDLSDILRRRAALSREPLDRAKLLRRRAKVLMEWLDSPEDAAAALRHARTIDPNDDGIADDLVQALVKAHREREAASILEGRIVVLKEADAGAGDIAALLVRLADLRADHLRNTKGAHHALEEALTLVPDYPTGLSTLARLAEADEDPRAYAEARLREADVREDIEAKVEALLDAGITLRDRCEDMDAARSAFERVLEMRPYNSEAAWALAGLVEQGGDPESAAALLETRLDSEEIDSYERARLLTQLAALARQAGVDAAAERRLDEALEAVPDHLPAVIARADLFSSSSRWQDLEVFLNEMLPQLEESPAAARAELHLRLAIAYEQLDRADDAYQTLLSADRIHRGHLLVKLALGENRYRARRWREAALHLSAAATHEDAENHRGEVAEGLYHAALAEIRSLRQEKAPALYERALELKPNYAPALRALAELAMERGDNVRAADLLTRQATATEEPDERVRLFEALGDMAVKVLNDEDRARICYESAVNAASPLEAKHLGLLEKLLERQDLANDFRGAARTAELMASFGSDAGARAARFTAAAENYLAADDKDKAREAAQRAVDADPYELTAVTVLSDLMLQAGDFEGASAMLGVALSGKDDGDEMTAARKSQLWHRLAEARRSRGDVNNAVKAFEKSITLASDSDGAMTSRRALLEIWKDDDSQKDTLIEFRRTLAADTRETADVVEYATALFDADRASAGAAVLELAETLGHNLDAKQRGLLNANPPRKMAADEPYRDVLSDDDRVQLIHDEADWPITSILRTLWGAAPLLWSEPNDALERCGVIGAKRVAATSALAAVSIFPRVAAALDTPATLLYVTDVPDAPDVQVVCVSAPIVVLGPRLQGLDDRAFSELELRFMLGRAAELARPERVIAAGLPREDFVALITALERVFGGSGESGSDEERERDEMLRTTLPVKMRTNLEKLFKQASKRDLDVDRLMAATERAADRAGLMVCGDIATATKFAGEMSKDGRILTRHLTTVALRPRYLAVRKLLGLSG